MSKGRDRLRGDSESILRYKGMGYNMGARGARGKTWGEGGVKGG